MPSDDLTATPPTVTFSRSGRTAVWDGSHASLLELAEANGLAPDFSCRAGICGTCQCKLVAGEVTYVSEPLDPPEEGMAHICCTRPSGNVTLDL